MSGSSLPEKWVCYHRCQNFQNQFLMKTQSLKKLSSTKKILQRGLALAALLLGLQAMMYSQVPKNSTWDAPASAKGVKNPIAADAASLAAGKKAFEKECLSCHGKKGKGDGPSATTLEVSPASLLSDKVQSQTDGELFWKITQGKKPMSSAKKTLTEQQRWQVVNYVRQLAENAKSKKKGRH
jgi:mono/diheme cytochrome c family protein